MNILVFDLDNTLLHLSNFQLKLLQINSNSNSNSNIKKVYNTIVPKNTKLKRLLSKFNNHKFIFSNAQISHVIYSLNSLDILDNFTNIYSHTTVQLYKPHLFSYYLVQSNIALKLSTTNFQLFFFDDLIENLKGAKEFNWTTILIGYEKSNESYIDYCFTTIEEALTYFQNKL